MRRLIILGLALVLGGCAGVGIPLYVVPLARSGATFQDFMNDRLACLEYATPKVAARGGRGRGVLGVGEPSASLYINCMYAKGWVRQDGGFKPPAGVPMSP